jgi:hypothetical protein
MPPQIEFRQRLVRDCLHSRITDVLEEFNQAVANR